MTMINPYLHFDGNAEEAFNFYKSVFGGEFSRLARYGEMPASAELPDDGKISETEKEKIMHVALPIGGDNVLMASDVCASMGQTFTRGDGFSLSVHAGSRADAERFFAGLGAGGKVEMPLADTFWGDYFGMLQDKFGVHWLVSASITPAQT